MRISSMKIGLRSLNSRKFREYLLSLQLDQLNFDHPIGLQRLPDELLQSSAAYSAQPDGLPELLLQFESKLNSMLTEE